MLKSFIFFTAELQKNKKLSLEELFQLVREKALSLVPIQMEQDMIKRIEESYSKDLPIAKESLSDPI
ncbi:hypothetical protein JTE90_007717 [Oedothorax gibbosus]|uniref:Uncharacterized protein n=1 Tax=Oedothorax gibbosus TaxID=931172 RepID=A0AAV6V608_9ARAC|nr:hypothetical protein JTE90_007717 [Oedothorax gibbosus]